MSKYNWEKEEISLAVKNSDSYSEVLRKMGIPVQGNNGTTLKNKIKEYGIDISHFTFGNKNKKSNKKQKELTDLLVKGNTLRTSKLKSRLLKEGLKSNLCENPDCPCHTTDTWLGRKIIMQLHHIDGDNTNNELSNLMMLCPNCHSQTDNYCGSANVKQKNHCLDCGKEIGRNSKYCMPCSLKHRNKTKPSIDELVKVFKTTRTFTKTGKHFNVTEAAVRKWFNSYGYPNKINDLIKFLNI